MLEPPIQREVYTLTTWAAQPADGNGAADGADGAPAPAKKKRGKAELRAQLEGETDPYRLLELEELRWRATQDDVRKAYRRLVLLHHPDKQDAAKAKAERAEAAAAKARDADGDADDDDDADAKKADDDEDEGDEMFRAITGAFELLSNSKKRRDFDSLDDFGVKGSLSAATALALSRVNDAFVITDAGRPQKRKPTSFTATLGARTCCSEKRSEKSARSTREPSRTLTASAAA